jgi:hypothetical protein
MVYTKEQKLEIVDAMLDQIPYKFNDITDWNIARDKLADYVESVLTETIFK